MHRYNQSLVALGRALQGHGYRFISVTPRTHELVLNRDERAGRTLRDVFGWNRPFHAASISPEILELANEAGVLEHTGDSLRSRVRFATLGQKIFVHSAFPTMAGDAVFFGPDSYRFCGLVARSLGPCKRLVDVGCGSGVGGLCASDRAAHVVLADVNESALELAKVNAELAGVSADVVNSDVLASVDGAVDAIIANPPYMCDVNARTYRDGGGQWGEALAVRIVRESLARLTQGGTLVLYTGAAIVDGDDVFYGQVAPLCREAGAAFDYHEIDPDVFGEELHEPAYARVERIAAVGLVATIPIR